MKNFYLKLIFAVIMAFATGTASANVTVTAATGGTCANLSPGAYVVLSNITITEGAATDFAVQSGTTLILQAPTGFEFRAGTGSVNFVAGQDITSASVSVTPSQVTVTLNVATNTKMDVLRIRLIQIRSLVPYASGNIVRPVAGGTAIIAGNAAGASVNHGTLTTTGTGAMFVTAANGNWSSAATWVGGIVPSCNDNVTISHTVTNDAAVGINNLEITNSGNLITTFPVTVSGSFDIPGTGTYTHDNISPALTTIFNGAENFSPTSNIVISRWYNNSVPFPTGVSGDFGNITFNSTGAWNQGGMFSPARIKGTMTVSNGILTMDNGSGMTTSLTLQDVLVTGTGRLIVQSGTARDLNFTTNNFTDNSTNNGYSYIMSQSVGNLVWNVNGNLLTSHRITLVDGTAVTDVGSAVVNVTGNLEISGGIFNGVRNATGSISMTVNGTSTISNTVTSVALKENYSGDVTFTSGSMTVSAGLNNYFMRANGTTGSVNVNITGDLNVTGASTRFFVASSNTNFNDVNVTISNDLNLNNAQLYIATTDGDASLSVGRNFLQSGAGSIFYGQRYGTGTGTTDIIVYGGLYVAGGNFFQSNNTGTTTLNITEALSVQNASFYGMNNTTAGNNGTASLVCTDLDLSGANFYLTRGEVNDSRIVNVDISGQMTVNFTDASQQVFFISKAGNNNAVLDLNIGTNLFVTGTANGLMCTSMSEGAETVAIGGDVSISQGRVRFNAYEGSTARGHEVNATISGSLVVSGGSICLSSSRGNSTWTIMGDYDQTGGYAVYKWHSGISTATVQGNYNLENGNVIFYSRAASPSVNPVTMQINGNANFSGCNVMFDSCLTSSATHRMIFSGGNVTYGDNVIFNHSGHLSTRTVFGNIVFNRAGTINLNRNSANFDIRQVKQFITAGTTVNFASSPFDLMVASHVSNIGTTHTTLSVDGTLRMGTNMIAARQQAGYYSSVDVNSGARISTAHTNGFYSGTSTPSCIYPMIDVNANMNYFLHANSIVEYNGTNTQIITGLGNGLAMQNSHRYGILDINFQGTPDVEFTHPDGDFVYIRTELRLTDGELNLDTDHVTANGGHILNIENGASVNRTDGYIRSETEDGSAMVSWNISANGSFEFPFGYNSMEFIPLIYQPVSGNSGLVRIATYHSATDNTPYPPTVSHVRNLTGIDNSTSTVDRFWRIQVPGNVTANVTFRVTNAELAGISNPRAQLWEPVSQGWFPPAGVQSNPTVTSTTASGLNNFNQWWTLSSSISPLPVELISFNAYADKKHVNLEWITATELNNDFFTVQRSANGETFEDVVRVSGAGTTSAIHEYSEKDMTPLKGLSYYRLKQTDFDGSCAYSEIRKVSFNKETPVSVYPNPVIDGALNIATGETVTSINIFDLAGKLILSQVPSATDNQNRYTFNDVNNQLPEGTYMVEINTTEGKYRERIIKL